MKKELICEKKKEAVIGNDKLSDDEKMALMRIIDEIAFNMFADLVTYKLYEYNRMIIAIMEYRNIDIRELLFTEKEVEQILSECIY